MSSAKSVIVLGAGSWGTALAIQLARAGGPTLLWGRGRDRMSELESTRCNRKYLPKSEFPENLHVTCDLEEAVEGAPVVLVATPSHAFHEILQELKPILDRNARVAWACKGFEPGTGRLLDDVAVDVLGRDTSTAVVSGPTFAAEVAAGLPTAVTIASHDEGFAEEFAKRISSETFRAYTSTDIIGVEVGGAVKNVLAIGAGVSDGLGFGANARIALITRGLAEVTRLGVTLGAKQETFMGLAGMGDLVLTCTDNQSRNRRMGLALAEGKSVGEAADEIGQVVEGVKAAAAVHEVAERNDIEMPISEQVYRVLYDEASPREIVADLMTRALKSETS